MIHIKNIALRTMDCSAMRMDFFIATSARTRHDAVDSMQ
jgi:hypothetical protein